MEINVGIFRNVSWKRKLFILILNWKTRGLKGFQTPFKICWRDYSRQGTECKSCAMMQSCDSEDINCCARNVEETRVAIVWKGNQFIFSALMLFLRGQERKQTSVVVSAMYWPVLWNKSLAPKIACELKARNSAAVKYVWIELPTTFTLLKVILTWIYFLLMKL